MSANLFTPWFPPGVEPVREGWYVVQLRRGLKILYWRAPAWFDNDFDFDRGNVIGWHDGQRYHWRGLTRDLSSSFNGELAA